MHVGEVVDGVGQRLQPVTFLLEEVDGTAVGLAVDAHVGDGIEPLAGGRVEVAEVGDFEAGEEVFLDIADAGFDAALLVTGADVAGRDLEPVMTGEVDIAGVEHPSNAGQWLARRKTGAECARLRRVAARRLHPNTRVQARTGRPTARRAHHRGGQRKRRAAHQAARQGRGRETRESSHLTLAHDERDVHLARRAELAPERGAGVLATGAPLGRRRRLVPRVGGKLERGRDIGDLRRRAGDVRDQRDEPRTQSSVPGNRITGLVGRRGAGAEEGPELHAGHVSAVGVTGEHRAELGVVEQPADDAAGGVASWRGEKARRERIGKERAGRRRRGREQVGTKGPVDGSAATEPAHECLAEHTARSAPVGRKNVGARQRGEVRGMAELEIKKPRRDPGARDRGHIEQRTVTRANPVEPCATEIGAGKSPGALWQRLRADQAVAVHRRLAPVRTQEPGLAGGPDHAHNAKDPAKRGFAEPATALSHEKNPRRREPSLAARQGPRSGITRRDCQAPPERHSAFPHPRRARRTTPRRDGQRSPFPVHGDDSSAIVDTGEPRCHVPRSRG